MGHPNEHVLCVNRSKFPFHTLPPISFDKPFATLEAMLNVAEFQPRESVEQDANFRQIVPYAIFNQHNKIFHFKRTPKAGEQRLVDKHSIGCAGHINELDVLPPPLRDDFTIASLTAAYAVNPWGVYLEGLNRELREELAWKFVSTHMISAIITDDRYEVDRYHVGIVHLLTLGEFGSVTITDKAQQQDGIIPMGMSEPCLIKAKELEGWSERCLSNLDKVLTGSLPLLPQPRMDRTAVVVHK